MCEECENWFGMNALGCGAVSMGLQAVNYMRIGRFGAGLLFIVVFRRKILKWL